MQSKRKRIVAGNWKMNTTLEEAHSLLHQLLANLPAPRLECVRLLLPPFTHLFPLSEPLKTSDFVLGAQSIAHEPAGAFTGEVSARMLASLGVRYVLIGHSERRQLFNEDKYIQKKIQCAQAEDIMPIVCCGEPLEVRTSNKQEEFVGAQLKEVIAALDVKKGFVLAYEPIWAIGTGQTASPAQAQAMHQYLRELLQKEMGEQVANQTSILYGGSVKANTIEALMAQPDIDGALVGGASLDAKEFLAIAEAVAQ